MNKIYKFNKDSFYMKRNVKKMFLQSYTSKSITEIYCSSISKRTKNLPKTETLSVYEIKLEPIFIISIIYFS